MERTGPEDERDARRWPSPKVALATAAMLLGRRALGWLVLGNVAAFALAFVEIAIAAIVQLVLRSLGLVADGGAKTGAWGATAPALTTLALVFFAVGVVRLACQYAGAQAAMVVQEATVARLRRLAVYEMLLGPARGPVDASAVQARVGDTALKASLFAYSAVGAAVSGIQSIALLVVLFFLGPREASIALFGLVVVGAMVIRVGRRAEQLVEKVPGQLRLLTEGIERVARNATLVRVLRTETEEHARLALAIDRYEGYHVHAASLGSWATALTPFLGLGLVLAVLALGHEVLHTAPLLLVSFLYLFMRFVQSLSATVALLGTCSQVAPQARAALSEAAALDRSSIATAVAPVARRRVLREAASSHDGAPPAIVVDGVSFRYPKADSDALVARTLTIAAGEHVGIVGASGCGKSTLLGLVLGVLEPTAGEVTIAGESPSAYFGRDDVTVGYVGSESWLVAGTVRENLLYGARAKATDAELFAALALARLDAVVAKLPAGLDYTIEEDGSGLSAGQKQRLCLARALLGAPRVLVLDEATANLDEATESEIAATLAGLVGKTTVVIVSHRKGILANVARVVSLGD